MAAIIFIGWSIVASVVGLAVCIRSSQISRMEEEHERRRRSGS